jgi:hypothetical protein
VIERRVDGQGDAADRKPWIRGKKALLEATLAKAASLARFSERRRVVPELQIPTLREVFVHRYRLLYEVSDAVARDRTCVGEGSTPASDVKR